MLAAYQWIQANPAPTSTPTATPTDTPLPSDTPTPTATPDTDINLALNRPVSVSSIQDSSHDGSQAEDGDLGTYWQTARATGRHTLSAEWITVDLGSSQTVGQVVLEWDAYYATSYTLQVSNDSSSWSMVSSTTSGDGANDTLTFSPVTARYVKLNTTAWSSGSQRNYLRELQVFAGGGGTAPSATPTPLPTATATPTATPSPTATTGASASLHVGDLDGATSIANHGRWNGTVTLTVHSSSETPVSGASVSGSWEGGASAAGAAKPMAQGPARLRWRTSKALSPALPSP